VIEGLKPYPEMKPSGVTWLGDVPTHWEATRVKHLFRSKKVVNSDRRETNVLSLTLRGVVNNDPENPEGLVPKDYATYQIFEAEDLVFKLIDLENLRTSRVGLVHERGIMSSAYVRISLNSDGYIRYFYHQFFDLYARGIYNQLGAGVRSTLGASDLLNLTIAVPPPSEQEAIVCFVEHADRLIGRYIRAKQALIKLLEEQKQAIIHQAVTRGLDFGVSLKSSGVRWLGDIPIHWQVASLGRHIDLLTGFPFRSEGFTIGDTDIRLLRGVNVTPGAIRWEDVVRWPAVGAASLREYELREGDVVLGMDRPMVGSGTRVAVVSTQDLPSLLLQRVARIRPLSSLSAEYLVHLLRGPGFSNYLAPIFTGVSVPHMSPAQIRNFAVPLPPKEEQHAIVCELRSRVSVLGETMAASLKEIALLREYRTRLIADVVTGKLDVREAAARLPVEVGGEDAEMFDAADDLAGEELAEELTEEEAA